MAFKAIVDLIWQTLSLEVRVSMDSPQKRGRGDYAGLYEPQQDHIAQLLWHKGMVHAFEACAAEIAHPTTSAKKDQQALWMGSFLKPGKNIPNKSCLL